MNPEQRTNRRYAKEHWQLAASREGIVNESGKDILTIMVVLFNIDKRIGLATEYCALITYNQ